MLRDKLKLALIAGILVAICGILMYSLAPAVKAQPYSEAIEIMNQAGTTAITTIIFPEADAGTEVTAPYNNLDSGTPQVFSDTASKPVATLISSTDYIVHCTIADVSGWATVVSNEKLYIDSAQTGTVDSSTFSGGAYTYLNWGTQENTTQSVDTNGNDLYLTIDLTAAVGKSGTSTLTILGE